MMTMDPLEGQHQEPVAADTDVAQAQSRQYPLSSASCLLQSGCWVVALVRVVAAVREQELFAL